MNSRHPDPRRVLGRCRAADRGPDPRDPTGSGDGFIFARFRCVLQWLVTRVTLRCNFVFDFFIPLSSKTPSFESFLARWPARNALKTRCFR